MAFRRAPLGRKHLLGQIHSYLTLPHIFIKLVRGVSKPSEQVAAQAFEAEVLSSADAACTSFPVAPVYERSSIWLVRHINDSRKVLEAPRAPAVSRS